MDIEANEREQLILADDIVSLWDQCPEDGDPTREQLDKMYGYAVRLAELVQAANRWKVRL
jgi:hypothetical protein